MQTNKRSDAALGLAVIVSPVVGVVVFYLGMTLGLMFILWAGLLQLYMFVPSTPYPPVATLMRELTVLSITLGAFAMFASFRWINRIGKVARNP
jgi:hypothetical protein